jgi:hypothetical protein
MPSEFASVFEQLRAMLRAHAPQFSVSQDADDRYCLVGPVGPATLKAWKGKKRSDTIPVAWVQIEKSYVSYHLMGVYGNPKLLAECSEELRARMQGKSCFNFKKADEPLLLELARLTEASLTGMRKAGMVAD